MAYIDHVTLNGSRQELVSKPATDSIAETYTSKTYSVGDRVMYEGRLYECTTAIATAESWTPAHWTAKNLMSDITDLKEDLNSDFVESGIADKYFTNVKVFGPPGDIIISNLRNQYGSPAYTGFWIYDSNEAGTDYSNPIQQENSLPVSGHYNAKASDGRIYDFDYDLSGIPEHSHVISTGLAHKIKKSKFYNFDASNSLISRFYGKKVSIIGDSIDTYNAPGYKIDGYLTHYPWNDVDRVEKTWWMQVIKASGANLEINASWAGSRVTNTHPQNYPDFYDRVGVLGSPNIIFVTLGTNDSNNNVSLGEYDFDTAYENLSETTFRTAYIKGMKGLKNLYPQALIVSITEKMNNEYRESIEYICLELGIECINASDYVSIDTVHPGSLGMNQIARLVLYPTDDRLNKKHLPADAYSTGKSIDALRESISGIEPGLSEEAKKALIDCFVNVAWINTNGQDYVDALCEALHYEKPEEIVINGTQFVNKTGWSTQYPYFTNDSTRLMYTELDAPVIGGEIYKVKVNTQSNNIRMFINLYNQKVVDQFAIQGNISASDHVDILGGWTTDLEQIIIIPKMINGYQTAGVVFGFSYTDGSNINNSAIESVRLQKLDYGTVPSGYVKYDYIRVLGDSTDAASIAANGILKTKTYADLNHVNIYVDVLPETGMNNSHISVMGGRASSADWSTCVAFYTRGSDNAYLVYSHTNTDVAFANAFVKGQVNHIELKQGNATPSVFINNGNRHEITWNHNNVINAPMHLFTTRVKDDESIGYISRRLQVGQFVIWENGENPDIYVPVVRDADNVIGLYNIAKKEFITCSDTTNATVGNSNCKYQVGNWS